MDGSGTIDYAKPVAIDMSRIYYDYDTIRHVLRMELILTGQHNIINIAKTGTTKKANMRWAHANTLKAHIATGTARARDKHKCDSTF